MNTLSRDILAILICTSVGILVIMLAASLFVYLKSRERRDVVMRRSECSRSNSWGGLKLFRSNSGTSSRSTESRIPIPSIIITDEEMDLPIVFYTYNDASQGEADDNDDMSKGKTLPELDCDEKRSSSTVFVSHRMNEMNAMKYFLERTAATQEERKASDSANPEYRKSAMTELQRQIEILQWERDFRPADHIDPLPLYKERH